jgi:hypothetical protein
VLPGGLAPLPRAGPPSAAAESGHWLADYARRHPRATASLLRVLGHDVDGSDAAVERVGADREHDIPIVALWPEGP